MPSVAAHLRLHRLQLSSCTTGRNSGLSSSASGWRRLCAFDGWGRAEPAGIERCKHQLPSKV